MNFYLFVYNITVKTKKGGANVKKDQTKSEELVYYEKLLEDKVAQNEKERQLLAGEKWGHVGGRLYKLSRVLFCLVAAYSLFFDLVFCLGWSLDLIGESVFNDSRNKLIIMLIITVLLVTAFVLVLKKRPNTLAATVITTPTAIGSALATWQWYNNSGTAEIATNAANNEYGKYWICNFPVVFLILFIAVMLVIEVVDKRYLSRVTSRTVRGLYDRKIAELKEESEDGEAGMLSDEEWLEVLKNYTEGTPDRKKKRSLKHKEKKNAPKPQEQDFFEE